MPEIGAMAHRYRLGDVVIACSPELLPGPYQIVQLLPFVAGAPYYHGQSTVDGHHGVLAEAQIKLARKDEA